MNSIRHNLYLYLVKAVNVVTMTVLFTLCWYGAYAKQIVSPFYFKGNLLMVVLFAFLYYNTVRIYDGIKISLYRISEMVYGQILALAVSDFVCYGIICLLSKAIAPLWPGLLCFMAQCLASVLWCVTAHKWYYRVFPPRKTAIVYREREEIEGLINAYGLSKKFAVKGYYHIEECQKDVSVLNGYKAVFLSGVQSPERDGLSKYCVEHGINLYLIPEIGDVIMNGAEDMHIFHRPVLRVGRYDPKVIYLLVKRIFDFTVSLAALVVTSPLFLITMLAVKSDGGPAFYLQDRLTKDRKVFKIIKFRSMRVDAEKDGVARLSTGDRDERITKVGRIIRKVRLDELPQLINILKGDMSIVGPRPERPEIAAEYEKELPEFCLRLQTKAGLTGLAQVYGKYNTTPYNKLVMDLMYIAHPSWQEDIKLMMATVKILFVPDSTEGIEVGQTTAMEETDEKKKVNNR